MAKAICISFFLIQVVKYHHFTKNELHQQDKFTLRSFKMMSIAYIAAFLNYTYEIVILVGKQYNIKSFEDWLSEKNTISDAIKYSFIAIAGTLMTICLVYNLARWYLIIQQMKGNNCVPRSFYTIINTFTITLVIVSLLLTIMIFMD